MTLQPPPDPILEYAGKPPRVSRLALAAMVLSILGALTFFLVIPSLLALILGGIASHRIRKRPATLAGLGFAKAAVTTSLCTLCMTILGLVFMPSMGGSGMSNRSYCAANLRGMLQSMCVYAEENNGVFPAVTYAPYSAALNSPVAASFPGTADQVINTYYHEPFPQAGSVTASLWLLVLRDQCAPKLFVCKDDPTIDAHARPQSEDGFYNNFQAGNQLSYSFAYPWKADGTVGNWWKSTVDASLPIAAGMAPEQGTGTPTRYLTPAGTPADRKTWNTGNHGGDGQNIGFADGHTEYHQRPDVGQNDDNIWTTSAAPSSGPAQFGGLPAIKASPNLTADKPPFDIVMYPIRNLNTGGL